MQKSEHAIFNDKYEINQMLGEGSTSKVYLGQELEDPSRQVAIKIIKADFLTNPDV